MSSGKASDGGPEPMSPSSPAGPFFCITGHYGVIHVLGTKSLQCHMSIPMHCPAACAGAWVPPERAAVSFHTIPPSSLMSSFDAGESVHFVGASAYNDGLTTVYAFRVMQQDDDVPLVQGVDFDTAYFVGKHNSDVWCMACVPTESSYLLISCDGCIWDGAADTLTPKTTKKKIRRNYVAKLPHGAYEPCHTIYVPEWSEVGNAQLYIAGGSEDHDIRHYDVEYESTSSTASASSLVCGRLEDHFVLAQSSGYVMGLVADPSKECLYSMSSDGLLRTWSKRLLSTSSTKKTASGGCVASCVKPYCSWNEAEDAELSSVMTPMNTDASCLYLEEESGMLLIGSQSGSVAVVDRRLPTKSVHKYKMFSKVVYSIQGATATTFAGVSEDENVRLWRIDGKILGNCRTTDQNYTITRVGGDEQHAGLALFEGRENEKEVMERLRWLREGDDGERPRGTNCGIVFRAGAGDAGAHTTLTVARMWLV